MKNKIWIRLLAIKYWYQGDTWENAVAFATRVVNWDWEDK